MTRGRKILVVIGIVAALFLPGIARVGARQTHAPARRLVHVVRPGETLWGISRRLHLREPVARTVDRLIRDNRLSGGAIHAGQPLFLPAS
jgi:LysM repeat protein